MANTTTKKSGSSTAKKSTTAKKTSTAKKSTTTAKKPAEAKKTMPAEEPVVATELPQIEPNPIKDTRDDEIAELKAIVKQLQAELAQRNPQITQAVNDSEKVLIHYQAECADNNVVSFGPGGLYGQITGKTGDIIVPKAEWSRFATDVVQKMIKKRQLIVLSGFTDEEREVYGINYKDGEILDKKAFAKLLDMGRDILAIFPALCPDHKVMVAKRFIDGFEKGHPTAHDRELVVALNELSKEDFKNADKKDPRRRGLFATVIDGLNAKDAE